MREKHGGQTVWNVDSWVRYSVDRRAADNGWSSDIQNYEADVEIMTAESIYCEWMKKLRWSRVRWKKWVKLCVGEILPKKTEDTRGYIKTASLLDIGNRVQDIDYIER